MKQTIIAIIIIALLVLGVYLLIPNSEMPQEQTMLQQDTPAEVQQQEIEIRGTYEVQEDQSVFTWESFTVIGGGHEGTVPISGEISVNADSTDGAFIFDVSNITSDTEMLTEHLKTADFFDVATYPKATFNITSVSATDIQGDLTIKDITQAIRVPVEVVEQGNTLTVSGETTIDRTLFGIIYGSGSFFTDLGDSAVKDEIAIRFSVVLKKSVALVQ